MLNHLHFYIVYGNFNRLTVFTVNYYNIFAKLHKNEYSYLLI